jgi:transcriptional regulator with XRE-family HTH domain
MSIPLCIMDWEVYDTGNQTSMQMNTEAFAIWLDAELKRRDMSALELERLSGVPDSTTSRIINLEVEEVKASVIAQIAKGLNEDFWKLMNIAGFAGKPGDLDEESAALAVTLRSQPDLADTMREMAAFDPEDRDAIRVYMADLRRRRQARRVRKKLRSSGEKK